MNILLVLIVSQLIGRRHILEHLHEIAASVQDIDRKCSALLSEQIDEATHMLQYKLDHTRRLLEGSECMLQGDNPSIFTMSQERIIAMRRRLRILDASARHIMDHMNVSYLRFQMFGMWEDVVRTACLTQLVCRTDNLTSMTLKRCMNTWKIWSE